MFNVCLQAKSTISVNGNVFTHVMKFPEGAITISRAFSDNELVTVSIVKINIFLENKTDRTETFFGLLFKQVNDSAMVTAES